MKNGKAAGSPDIVAELLKSSDVGEWIIYWFDQHAHVGMYNDR